MVTDRQAQFLKNTHEGVKSKISALNMQKEAHLNAVVAIENELESLQEEEAICQSIIAPKVEEYLKVSGRNLK